VALGVAAPAGAQHLPALYDVVGVAADDVLNIREAPDAASPVVAGLAPGGRGIEVTALSDNGWAWVNTAEGSGWVSLRYLEPGPHAPWWDPATRLSCYGTEPFWSLILSGDAARFTSALDENVRWTVTGRSTSYNRPDVQGMTIGPGFAVLKAEACSDGMSDLNYGLALEFFRPEGDALGGYSGCCTLGH
jgi:uncharacterized membrane protein